VLKRRLGPKERFSYLRAKVCLFRILTQSCSGNGLKHHRPFGIAEGLFSIYVGNIRMRDGLEKRRLWAVFTIGGHTSH